MPNGLDPLGHPNLHLSLHLSQQRPPKRVNKDIASPTFKFIFSTHHFHSKEGDSHFTVFITGCNTFSCLVGRKCLSDKHKPARAGGPPSLQTVLVAHPKLFTCRHVPEGELKYEEDSPVSHPQRAQKDPQTFGVASVQHEGDQKKTSTAEQGTHIQRDPALFMSGLTVF